MERLDNSELVVTQVKTLGEVAKYFHVRRDTVKEWKNKGMPVEPTGLYDLTKVASWRHTNRVSGGQNYIYPMANIGDFKKNRANIYAREQAEDVKIQQAIRHYHFSKEQIRELATKDAIALYDELRRDQKDKFEQERLERGESTGNIAVMVNRIKELKMKRKSKGDSVDG